MRRGDEAMKFLFYFVEQRRAHSYRNRTCDFISLRHDSSNGVSKASTNRGKKCVLSRPIASFFASRHDGTEKLVFSSRSSLLFLLPLFHLFGCFHFVLFLWVYGFSPPPPRSPQPIGRPCCKTHTRLSSEEFQLAVVSRARSNFSLLHIFWLVE